MLDLAFGELRTYALSTISLNFHMLAKSISRLTESFLEKVKTLTVGQLQLDWLIAL